MEIISGINVIRGGNQEFGVKFRAFFWYSFGKHPKFDLIVDEIHGIPFFTPLYIKTRKLAFIHEVAGEVWKLNPWPKPMNLIPWILGTIFEPWIFKVFYKKIPFLTVSESTKNDLISFGIPKKNVFIIKNGARILKSGRDIKKESLTTALFLGALSEDKGVFDAIKIFGEIERKAENWQYWIVGAGSRDYINKLKDEARKMNVIYKTKFWGYVNDRKKFDLLARAHVLINPSYHEGWGLVNLEANACQTPVLGYKVHGTKDSVRDGVTGILVEKGDFRSLAENAIKLVMNKEVYGKMQKNAVVWASKFSWDKATGESLDLIESI